MKKCGAVVAPAPENDKEITEESAVKDTKQAVAAATAAQQQLADHDGDACHWHQPPLGNRQRAAGPARVPRSSE